MTTINRCAFSVVLLAWLVTQAVAGNAFVLPANTFDTAVPVFTESPFQSVTTLTVPPAVRHVIAKPDGSKFYVFSGHTSDSILVFDSALTTIVKRVDLAAAVRVAGISPDGTRLFVLADGLHIYDLTKSSEPEITPSTQPDLGANPNDMAFTLDSKVVYFLSTSSGVVTRYEVGISRVGETLELPGSPKALAMSPNGLLYVSATNRIYEVDPVAGTVVRDIGVNGAPGKGAFTPDGKYALFPNAGAFVATGLGFLLDTTTGQVRVIPRTGKVPEVVLDQVAAADENTFFAVSDTTDQVVRLSVEPFALATSGFLLANKTNVRAIAVSKELPAASYLFVATGTGISRGRLADEATTELSLPVPAGRVEVAGAASGAPPTGGFYRFNDGQILVGGTTSKPLIMRVWDANGLAAFNKTVEFTSDTPDVTFDPPSAKLSLDGFAQTRVTVPDVPGAVITIEASIEGRPTPITYELKTAGGGSGETEERFAMDSGNGQVVQRAGVTRKPLRVKLTGADGAPLAGATVAWALAPGSGDGFVSKTETKTDAHGIAETYFVGIWSITTADSWKQSTITATTAGHDPVEFVVTTVPTLLTGDPATPRYMLSAPAPGTGITGQAGQVLPGGVRVIVTAVTGTRSGMGIPNIGATIASDLDPATSPSASCVGDGSTALSDASGVINCDARFGGVVGGPVPVRISVAGGGEGGDFFTRLTVTPGPPSAIAMVAGNGQTGGPGVVLPTRLSAEVSDGFGHVLPNTDVTWDVLTPTTASIVSATRITDAQGRVSAQIRLGNVGGAAQIRLRTGSAEVVFNLNVLIPVSALVKVSGDGQSGVASQAFASPLVVQARNAQGQAVSGASVAFQVVSGSATVNGSPVTTGADGRASVTVTAGAASGALVIRATSGDSSVTFNLTVSVPVATLAKISGDGQVAKVGQDFGAPLVVELRDQLGAVVPGAAVAFEVISGPATIGSPIAVSGANGQASTTVRAGTATGAVVVRVTSFSLGATFNLSVVPPGPAVTLANIRSAVSGELGVTAGGMVAIYGQGIAPNIEGSVVANGGFVLGPLPTNLASVEVLFGLTNAPIYNVNNINGQEWVVVQAPFSLTPGVAASVTVRVNGGATTVDGVEVKDYQPGILDTMGPTGQKWAVLTKADGSYVTPDNPIHAGVDTTVRMYCSGLGQTNPVLATGAVGIPNQTSPASLSLYILTSDGSSAQVVSAKPMEGVVGVYVLTVSLPAALEKGSDKILILGVNGASGPFHTIASSSIAKID